MRIAWAWRSINTDQAYLAAAFPSQFTTRSRLRAYLLNPSIKLAFLMRLASGGKWLGYMARRRLLRQFSCDVSPGAQILGAIYLPHPIGIVIGSGAKIGPGVSIYQQVTLGADKRGSYPTIGAGAVIFPGSVIAGNVTIGERAVIGAGLFVSKDVGADQVLRVSSR